MDNDNVYTATEYEILLCRLRNLKEEREEIDKAIRELEIRVKAEKTISKGG